MLGVVSTNALELGIDIGSLDVAVLLGYPGSVASAWQQAGRAGRRSGTSVAVLVANSTPLNQFIAKNPDYFFGAPVEQGRINPDNLQILVNHIKCAAFELPFVADEPFGKENLLEILKFLEEERLLHRAGERWHWTSDSYPADAISLRSVSSDNFVIQDVTARAADHRRGGLRLRPVHGPREGDLHPRGADLLRGEVRPRGAPRPRARGGGRLLHRRDHVHQGADPRALRRGAARATRAATTARCTSPRRWWASRRSSSTRTRTWARASSSMPENEMHTTSYWLTIPREIDAGPALLARGAAGRRGGALLHARPARRPLPDVRPARPRGGARRQRPGRGADRAGPPAARGGEGRRRDEPLPGDDYEPNIFVYDDYPGGIGLSEPLYRLHDRLLAESRALIAACPCVDGCPSCVGPAGEVGSKGQGGRLGDPGGRGHGMTADRLPRQPGGPWRGGAPPSQRKLGTGWPWRELLAGVLLYGENSLHQSLPGRTAPSGPAPQGSRR